MTAFCIWQSKDTLTVVLPVICRVSAQVPAMICMGAAPADHAMPTLKAALYNAHMFKMWVTQQRCTRCHCHPPLRKVRLGLVGCLTIRSNVADWVGRSGGAVWDLGASRYLRVCVCMCKETVPAAATHSLNCSDPLLNLQLCMQS
jgi:hypothetical protein